MAKNKAYSNGTSFGTVIKRFFIFGILALIAVGGFWALEERPEISQYFDFGTKSANLQTFELVHPPEAIMQRMQKELLRTPEHSFAKPYVQFSPMLMLHVKYSPNQKLTEEADCLWDQNTAEMVLDTATFETTHGFQDCMNQQANEEDFRILHALAKHSGSLNKDKLASELGMDIDVLSNQLATLKRKHLIVQKQDMVTLHFQSPLLKTVPKTNQQLSFVEKQVPKESRLNAKYSKSQIQKLAQDAFGTDFAIRSSKEVYLPIVVVVVQNPDGSELKTFFNGVTGKRIKV
ncbi:MAG: hypothetical protein LLF94_01855 [Chlamydiales bacterium]|nr:hypothetical protein [Chlamydiales bacterium]